MGVALNFGRGARLREVRGCDRQALSQPSGKPPDYFMATRGRSPIQITNGKTAVGEQSKLPWIDPLS